MMVRDQGPVRDAAAGRRLKLARIDQQFSAVPLEEAGVYRTADHVQPWQNLDRAAVLAGVRRREGACTETRDGLEEPAPCGVKLLHIFYSACGHSVTTADKKPMVTQPECHRDSKD